MAIPFLNNINLSNNELQNAKLHITGSLPSPSTGNIYYDGTTDNKVKVRDNLQIQTVAWESWVTSNYPGTVTSVSSATTNQLTITNGSTAPSLSIVTGAIVNGGTALATGDQIYDFVTGLGYSTTVGTVTSVAIEGTDGIDIDSGSPITSAGTITLGLSNVPNTSLANSSITIGDSTIALGGTDTTLTGLTDIDLTEASHTIFDNVGANTLTIGASTTTIVIPGDLQVTGTVTTNNVETVSTSNGVVFEGNAADENELTLLAGTLTADRTITLPDATGTVALTSDLHDAVTLAGSYDYITISGQQITVGQIDYNTDIVNAPVVTDTQLATREADIDVSNTTFIANKIATINHALNSENVIVQMYDKTTGAVVHADIEHTSDGSTISKNHVRIEFGVVPANDIRVIMIDAKDGATSVTPSYS